MPSHDTFSRVFRTLDSAEFLLAMHSWVDHFATSLQGQGVAIDGKVLRGSFDKPTEQSVFHTITAFATKTRLCLGEMTFDGKCNEIPAVPQFLELLELSGAVVKLDAMHCQVKPAQSIVDAQADYILTVKGDQPSLFKHLQELFCDAVKDDSFKPVLMIIHCEKSHGREQHRKYQTMAAPDTKRLKRWPKLRSITRVSRSVEKAARLAEEVMFYINSLPPRVQALARHIRGHWGIENQLHHVLDATFTEDSSRTRKGSGSEIAVSF